MGGWLDVDESSEVEEFFFGFDFDAFVAASEDGAAAVVAFVEVHGVAGAERAHETGDGVFGSLAEDEVEAVRHGDVGDELEVVVEVFGKASHGWRGLAGEHALAFEVFSAGCR